MIRLSWMTMVACVVAGCSSTTDAPRSAGAPAQDTSPTSPAPADEPADEAPAAPVPLIAAPGCGSPGARVVLRLGVDREGRAPACYRVEEFAVRFGTKPARIALLGPTDEGYCAVDVVVPDEATSAIIRVEAGRDVFESPTPFRVPCF